MKILYVEDEPNDAALVDLYVHTTEHELMLVSTAQEAEAALLQKPDLILLDLILGGIREGFDLAREFREQGYTRPMVAITALSMPQDQESCREVGINAMLSKPFTINQLAALIERYSR